MSWMLQDAYLGGGIPVGSVVLVVNENSEDEEDLTDYTRLFLKYFLCEGVAVGNDVFSAGCDSREAAGFVDSLPDVVDGDGGREEAEAVIGDDKKSEEELKIAWRYKEQLQRGGPVREGERRHSFNLNRPISQRRLEKVDSHTWKPESADLDGRCDRFRELYQKLTEIMSQEKYSSKLQVVIAD